MSNGFLAALDWLGEWMYGPVEPCGTYAYRDAAHRAKCRECRKFAQWLDNPRSSIK